eukprot:scaffold182817_cov19-Tisochrysis_lutea.AAC.1
MLSSMSHTASSDDGSLVAASHWSAGASIHIVPRDKAGVHVQDTVPPERAESDLSIQERNEGDAVSLLVVLCLAMGR